MMKISRDFVHQGKGRGCRKSRGPLKGTCAQTDLLRGTYHELLQRHIGSGGARVVQLQSQDWRDTCYCPCVELSAHPSPRPNLNLFSLLNSTPPPWWLPETLPHPPHASPEAISAAFTWHWPAQQSFLNSQGSEGPRHAAAGPLCTVPFC